MSSTLRPIAVHVEEPKPKQFRWVLLERAGARWSDIEKSNRPVRSYQRAMADGLLALQAMVDDLDVGPRRAEPTEESHVTTEVAQPAALAGASAPKRYFGFGPAR
ncbi:hypothetical protein [Pseudorhodoferax sp. Leaf267]|uniref:hypothetical protein n=1 Tax=Pseudorhodoferax sp. Leaf267 TaxID=1736316 RepID=UPI0006F20332|nr:hypothetical protein [Pseudorhodoferax sp. Leaf267]KQP15182.1 hypothetical protein ASF43_14255 [Pseudorhodoferax sp. Leaf267]